MPEPRDCYCTQLCGPWGPKDGLAPHVRCKRNGPVKDLNPKQRFGDLKMPLAYVPFGAIIGMARAFKEGARKYGPFNWREKKVEAMTYGHASLRHIYAWIDGEDVDPESSDDHLDHAMACLGILQDARDNGVLADNRPPKGRAGELLRAAAQPPVQEWSDTFIVNTAALQRELDRVGFDVIADQPAPIAFTHCSGCHSTVCEHLGRCTNEP